MAAPRKPISFMNFQLICFFFFFPFLLTSSLSPTKADEYFIDCGSSSNTTTNDGRIFVGDKTDPGPPGVELLGAGNSPAMDVGNQSKLYRTAMIFSSPSCYKFNINKNGTYVLRLHFYAFSSSSALTTAQFNVSASGYMLLSNFSGRGNPDSPVLKEFLLTVNTGEFNVYFVPGSSSAVAFVSAIELFLTPLKTTSGSPVAVSTGLDINLVSRVLHPVYRINFGGQTVHPSNDRLWRTWLSDDPYLLSKSAAKNGPMRISRPDYQGGNATDYDAPDAVYKTAKELNVSFNHQEKFFNATWRFKVSRSSVYFVRVHFCDVISEALGAIVFNLYVSSHFEWKVDPYSVAPDLAAPFYLDFLVKSDKLGYLNISIGPRNDTRITENAFLNGLEIMEILSTTVVEPELMAPCYSKKRIVAFIGLVACGVALVYVLGARFCSDLKPNKAKQMKGKPVAAAFSHRPLVNKFVETAEKCLRSNGADRPQMLDVSRDLEVALQLQKIGNPAEQSGDDDTATDASVSLLMDGVPCFPSDSPLTGR